jgi:hypothetical protein
MSANFRKEDGYVVTLNKNHYIDIQECEIFDKTVENDIIKIKYEMEQTRIFQRMAILRILQTPFEYIFSRLFISKRIAKRTQKQFILCIKFLRKKLTFKEFQKENGKLE